MLEHLERALAPAGRESVVDGGGQVEEHHGRGEHARADHEQGRPPVHRLRQENGGSHECRDQADTVADAVRNLFAERLRTLECHSPCAHEVAGSARGTEVLGAVRLGQGAAFLPQDGQALG